MSKTPIDKRQAPQPKRPWYLRPITFKVTVLVLRVAARFFDLIG